jgi:hypothetical protein
MTPDFVNAEIPMVVPLVETFLLLFMRLKPRTTPGQSNDGRVTKRGSNGSHSPMGELRTLP